MELPEKLAQPAAIGEGMGDGMVLCFSTRARDFSTRARDSGLTLG